MRRWAMPVLLLCFTVPEGAVWAKAQWGETTVLWLPSF